MTRNLEFSFADTSKNALFLGKNKLILLVMNAVWIKNRCLPRRVTSLAEENIVIFIKYWQIVI
jgi:hypothetical protein